MESTRAQHDFFRSNRLMPCVANRVTHAHRARALKANAVNDGMGDDLQVFARPHRRCEVGLGDRVTLTFRIWGFPSWPISLALVSICKTT